MSGETFSWGSHVVRGACWAQETRTKSFTGETTTTYKQVRSVLLETREYISYAASFSPTTHAPDAIISNPTDSSHDSDATVVYDSRVSYNNITGKLVKRNLVRVDKGSWVNLSRSETPSAS